MHRNRRLPLIAVIAVIGLALVSCLPVPLGDPEQSRVHQKYVGAWMWRDDDESHVAILRPWDSRTYALHLIDFTGTPQQPGEIEHSVLKGWLTEVGGETFLTLQSMESLAEVPGAAEDEKIYLICRLMLDGDRLVATSLNPSYPLFEHLRSSEELARIISQNMADPQMFASEPIDARRVAEGELESLMQSLK